MAEDTAGLEKSGIMDSLIAQTGVYDRAVEAIKLAKAKGCRVVGIAGGAAKCDWAVKEFGYDACVDYTAPDFAERDWQSIRAICR